MAGLFTTCAVKQNGEQGETDNSRFKNTEITYETHLSNVWQIAKAYLTAKREAPMPVKAIPVVEMTAQTINEAKDNTLFKLGHSTVLLKLQNQLVLFDPVFSERASPVQWAGPKRFHQPPITLDELPAINVVVISHDHYDHLDEAAIKQLDNKVSQYIVPRGLSKYLLDWGVSKEKIIELNWWQNTHLNGIEYIATPTQHFSGRGLFDRDQTLWASWVVRTKETNIYFSGDSGYFSGFKQIGEKYGPFDITMIETGAYNDLWSEIHMTPEESVQAHIDLQGGAVSHSAMLPIHNGTFDLALHDWYEPLERVTTSAWENSVSLSTPIVGQAIDVKKVEPMTGDSLWWRQQM